MFFHGSKNAEKMTVFSSSAEPFSRYKKIKKLQFGTLFEKRAATLTEKRTK